MNPRDLNQSPTAHVPIDGKGLRIDEARAAIAALTRAQERLALGGKLHTHIEWAKEALWAAAYPGSPDDTLINGLEAEAENALG